MTTNSVLFIDIHQDLIYITIVKMRSLNCLILQEEQEAEKYCVRKLEAEQIRRAPWPGSQRRQSHNMRTGGAEESQLHGNWAWMEGQRASLSHNKHGSEKREDRCTLSFVSPKFEKQPKVAPGQERES
ncbi:hypothetical protein CRENBAI_000508 [Crenichthys baileyi]|uniref:Uncharacterized protein n=1 Tax=Crenichthys baileyi TaxID=28760 RepID=A0AAV9RPH7_9TELE